VNIAINCRHLLSNKLEGFGNYTLEICKRICKSHPEHEFYLFFDRPFSEEYIFSNNVHAVVVGPVTRHPILNVIWGSISLKRALAKYNIDLFWSPDGICNLRTKTPQIITIHDLNFEHNPKDLPWFVRNYYRIYYPRFAKKAEHIISVSEYSKNDIIKTYGLPEEKVSPIYNGACDHFSLVNLDEKNEIRSKYAEARPFFVFVGSIHPRKNVERLLQAFSLYHKKYSEYHLVIVGSNMWRNQSIHIPAEIEEFVTFTGHVNSSDLAKIMGSSFALVYPPYFEGFGIPLVEAMKSGIPIVSSNKTCLPEIAGNAAIYFDPFNVEEMASQMSRINEDSDLRKELVENGKERVKDFSWDKTSEETWLVLEKFLRK